ncbi:unnamed protein product [marine sediment metagenome]|uniref:Glycosyl transferase family 3 domain-containing protein n=1 Tax=marine sediment metagenome TaxID=412755 RepID=X1DWI6_9ZZZZ
MKSAFVVWGEDGLDEISISGRTRITQLKENKINTYYVEPEDFGIKRACLDEIRGGTRQENARIFKDILEGAKGPKREIVLINAAACLVAADPAKDLEQGIQIAANSIDSGRAKKKLEALIDFTRN